MLCFSSTWNDCVYLELSFRLLYPFRLLTVQSHPNQVVAAFESLTMRLLGIALASLASGLGELTFLQLSTTYKSQAAGQAVGYFSSGTGCAGLLGAGLWWCLRSLGVREGVGISSVGLNIRSMSEALDILRPMI